MSIFPMIHMNGTGRKALTEGYEKANDAMQKAKDAFIAIEFNARDYYPIGETAFIEAKNERAEIAKKIEDVLNYLESHLEKLYE